MSQEVEAWEKILGQLAGVAGALVSLKFVQGTLFERFIMAFGGAAFSFYASEWASDKLSLPEGLTGFMLGLFGMSILSRAWEWLQSTNLIRDFLDAWLRRRTPPPNDK